MLLTYNTGILLLHTFLRLYFLCNIWLLYMEKRAKMMKLVFTGPECSGKTTLSTSIANSFNLPLVPEYAREFLNNLNRPYRYSDLVQIAKGQLALEHLHEQKKSRKPILICDTDLQVIKIWSKLKYSKCSPFILNNELSDSFYILCAPDFNWVYDSLRENASNRWEIFNYYKIDLITNKRRFIIVKGDVNNRLNIVSKLVQNLISSAV